MSKDESLVGSDHCKSCGGLVGPMVKVVTDEVERGYPRDTDAHLEAALHARTVIAQAQGILMARLRIDADAASSILVRTARAQGVPLLEASSHLAASVCDGVERIGYPQ